MPEQKELPLSELELVYLNGQEHGGAPVFKDVRLERDSQATCEHELVLAKEQDKRIRSESELKRCLDTCVKLRTRLKQLEWLRIQERKPWNHILSQIEAGISPLATQLQQIEKQLKQRIANWRAEVEEGRQKQQADSIREAEEYEKKAKYDSNPQNARKAEVAAKEVREEAKKFKKLKPIPGMATVVVYDYEIENRVLAAKLPAEAIEMSCNDSWFTARIKAAKDAGLPIPTFQGVRVTVKTEVRLPR
jgi:hypothetical protein